MAMSIIAGPARHGSTPHVRTRGVSPQALAVAAAAAIALIGARSYAGGWNDGSRLAAVESIADHHTLAIDDSIYVDPSRAARDAPPPYGPPASTTTLDRVRIGGRFYSDKPYVLSGVLAGAYLVLREATGLRASQRPDRFAWWMTVLSAGLGYVAAVAGIHRLARRRLAPGRAAFVTASFALGTVALPYSRHVNSHDVMLAIVTWIVVEWDAIASPANGVTLRRAVVAGVLAGAGYAVEPGIGPLLLAATLAQLAIADRASPATLTACAVAAAPFAIAHHAINLAIGGTLAPANMNVAALAWPGSPFDAATMTGRWTHDSAWGFAGYGLGLLAGPRGFVTHNLAIALAPVLAAQAVRDGPAGERGTVVIAAALSFAVWILYAALSTNYSGECVSIRWFVPLLAPAYFMLIAGLRRRPALFPVFVALAAWGFAMAPLMWWKGPWSARLIPFYWLWIAGGALSAGLAASRVAAFPPAKS